MNDYMTDNDADDDGVVRNMHHTFTCPKCGSKDPASLASYGYYQYWRCRQCFYMWAPALKEYWRSEF